MMNSFKSQLSKLLQDPRTTELVKNPRVQRAVVEGFRLKGRVEGALEQRLQRLAGSLNLATQRDLRALHRRVRHLERELRETEERLIEAEDAREALGRS